MKIQKKNNNNERQILIGMIVDQIVLGRISAKWQRGMFKSKWANIIAKWCLNYYADYENAPLNQIENLFEAWAEKTKDKESINLVDKFLNSLSEEYETLKDESNSDYVLDVAGTYFNKVKIEKLVETLEGNIIDGDIKEAANLIISYNQLEMGVGEGIDVLQDDEAIKEAFAEKQEDLFKYPGDLGRFFDEVFQRDSFIAFLGPDKSGKSFWLMDVAYRAMLQRKRVAYFEVGDMSQNQVMRRLMSRVSRSPKHPKIVDYPISIEKETVEDENGTRTNAIVDFKEKVFKKSLNSKTARKACKKLMRNKIKSKNPYLKLSCHPAGLVSVETIKSILRNWELDNWTADIIVIDYADLLNMDYHGIEGRDKIDETWKRLRSLSQSYHCSVVTATQADAASYTASILSRNNFSNDKRKNAHVTCMIGINVSEEEKEIGVTRLNKILMRDKEFNEKQFIYVAGCLSLANPAIKSCF